MSVRLVIQKGATKANSIELRQSLTIIGRHQDCDLRIPSSAVSRRHCQLSFLSGFLTVEDLDSANGTFVNGQRIGSPEIARPGDIIEIGPISFLVQYQLGQEAISHLLGQDDDESQIEMAEEVPEEVASAALDEDVIDLLPLDSHGQPSTFVNNPSAPVDVTDEPAVTQKKPKNKRPKPPSPPKEGEDEPSWRMPPGQDVHDFLSELDDK